MKSQSLAQILNAFGFAIGAVFTVSQPSYAKPTTTTFFCGIDKGLPATMAHTPQGDIPIILWDSRYFSSEAGNTPERRCMEVSGRFQTYQSNGTLNYLTTGIMNGEPVACVAETIGGSCTGLLFILQPSSDPSSILEEILVGIFDGTSNLRNEVGGTVYINMNEYLNRQTTDELFLNLEKVYLDEIYLAYDIGNGGFLSIPYTNSDELISIPVIWERRSSLTTGLTGIETDENYEELFAKELDEVLWWELRTLSESEPGSALDGRIKFTSVDFDDFSSDDDIFLIAGVDEELVSYINLDYPIQLRSENHFRYYAIVSTVPNSQPVPEPSYNFVILTIGAIMLILLHKDK